MEEVQWQQIYIWSSTEINASEAEFINFSGGGGPGSGYCTPSGGSTSSSYYLKNFSLSNINNTSSNAIYTDFTSLVANLNAGQSYTISVTSGSSGSIYHHAAVWIDYNDNGIFEPSEKVTYIDAVQGDFGSGYNLPSFVVLNHPGIHRLRIQYSDRNDSGSSLWGSNMDPCTHSYSNFTDTEDYLINILPNKSNNMHVRAVREFQ